MSKLTEFLRCERGASAIEYALVAMLIGVAAVSAFDNLGGKITSMYTNVASAM